MICSPKYKRLFFFLNGKSDYAVSELKHHHTEVTTLGNLEKHV